MNNKLYTYSVKNKIDNIKIVMAFLLIFSQNSCAANELFTKKDNGNIIAPDGVEYVFLANEGIIETFGERTFLGKIRGEASKLRHMGGSWDTGMYSCDDSNMNILYRIKPNSEWGSYYRKATLPEIDLRPENCIRFEFIHYKEIIHYENNISPDKKHMSCNDGITSFEEIQSFLLELKNEQSPKEAGLYDLIRKENGMLENCYVLGYVYGYLKTETNLAIPYEIVSFNDIAYSIHTNFGEYVLPVGWLEKLGYKLKE